MREKPDSLKNNQKVAEALAKAGDTGKRALTGVQVGAKVLADKSKSDSYQRRMKKYNPLFPEQYQAEAFHLPNMIKIVDDAVRRGIDVCEGAIGWLGTEQGMEVLYLYDEMVEMSGIDFVPAVTCDAVYYVDNFDRNRFIRTDCVFSKAHEERLAELKHIAHALGAKCCYVEVSESHREKTESAKKLSISGALSVAGKSTGGAGEESRKTQSQSASDRSGKIWSRFDGCSTPERPTLKWFAKDDSIKALIDSRFSDRNGVAEETIELYGSASATMSKETADKIDSTLSKMGTKLGVKKSSEMRSRAEWENRSILIFHVEF